jgi:H+/Cl- antiporter ClcA
MIDPKKRLVKDFIAVVVAASIGAAAVILIVYLAGKNSWANKARRWLRDFDRTKAERITMKIHAHQRTIILMIFQLGMAFCLSGCATERHPGPLGGVGDFLQDNPWAVPVLGIIIWGVFRKKK